MAGQPARLSVKQRARWQWLCQCLNASRCVALHWPECHAVASAVWWSSPITSTISVNTAEQRSAAYGGFPPHPQPLSPDPIGGEGGRS